MLNFTLLAQRQATTRATSSLRATALVEIARDGRARLVPVVLKEGDRFFDAALYRANPRPMALDPGVVYEATSSGESVGLFTVNTAQQVQGVWVGLGEWHPKLPGEPDVPEKKAGPSHSRSESDADAPPRLTRSKPSETSSPPDSNQGTSAKSPDAPSGSSPTNSKPQAASTKQSAEPPLPADDSGRPTLRRGKPAAQSNDDQSPVIAEKPGAVANHPALPVVSGSAASPVSASPAPKTVEVLTAVSDAAGPKPRTYAFPLKSDELAKCRKSLRQTAYDAIRKWAAIRPQHKPAALSAFSDEQIQVFDVTTSNEPELVLSAALPESLTAGVPTSFRYYATVVARLDMYGDLHTLLVQATDSAHLDEYPRLELIDVVDAEGSGIGQFLFR
ncbi:MAG: hypothetical protein ABSD20_14170, partial [Terriglobales bacterium]